MKNEHPLRGMKTPLNYTVLLIQKGIGVVAFETVAIDDTAAVTTAMNEAFKMFPKGKFALFGMEKTDGKTTISTTRTR